MDLSDLRSHPKARKQRKRIGRGIAAGQGKTSGRGEKGQTHRYSVPPGFEGGQTPLYRRIPTLRGRGTAAHNRGGFHTQYAVVNVAKLSERFEAGAQVDVASLLAAGLISKALDGVKILGQGEIDKPLHVKAAAFSATAREKIEAAKGTAEVSEA